ncbi:lPXTG-domain-containing protein cell wall anchor domain [Coprobacillus sp. CAG:235]|nr:lPXTG-domain-containing protein cell wall anchor domain [Coprobacillus sp. CAG:235]
MVPNMTGYNQYYYIFKDTMTEGLTVSKDTLNLVVKIGGTVVDTSEYTLTVDKTNRIFTVEFKNFYTNHAKDANESLTFTYSAVVNEKAINDTNTSTNKAEVSYGNDPDHLTTGAPSEVKVLTHTLKINKVDEQNKPLSGAEFALYRNNVDSGKLKFVDEGNGTYRIATKDDETTTDTLVSPEGGVITVKGLSEGDYVIEETKAPDGYAKLKNTINKTISVDGNAPQTVNVEEKVTNKTESWLPETGGMGTVIFTVVGVVGVLAILSTYFKKGKKREEA